MYVSVAQFIDSPAQYLEKIKTETVFITQNGKDVAVLSTPNRTPISDSLLGILKDSGIKNMSDIKNMRLGL